MEDDFETLDVSGEDVPAAGRHGTGQGFGEQEDFRRELHLPDKSEDAFLGDSYYNEIFEHSGIAGSSSWEDSGIAGSNSWEDSESAEDLAWDSSMPGNEDSVLRSSRAGSEDSALRSSRAADSRSASRRQGHAAGESGSSPRSRGGHRDQKKLSTTVKRIIIFSIAEVIALASIFSYAFVKKQYNKIQRPEVSVEVVRNTNLSFEDIQKMEEGNWTVAIFGVDSRDSSVGKGNNSDVIIIGNINKDTGEIKLTSVFRDTYLGIGDGSYNKINAAYCLGGPEQALKALNEDLDLNITQYATFNWKAVVTAINILGGVDVDISSGEFYYINSFITETVNATKIGSRQLTHAGMNHLDGVQAVAYARLRLMDNDYARTERQRKIIELCFQKAKQADVKTLTSMVGVMLELVATNMGWEEGLDVVNNLSKYHMGDTGGFPFARGEAVMGKRGSCIIPQTLESNVRDLHRFLYGEEEYNPSDSVKAMSAKLSAESGFYSEGKAVGHVSTRSTYIPKPTTAAAVQTTAAPAATSASSSESSSSSSESSAPGETIQAMPDGSSPAESSNVGNASGSSGNLKETVDQLITDLGLDTEREYAVSRDGYLVYASGTDAEGDTVYKYVLGDDGRRIRATEGQGPAPGNTGTTTGTGTGESGGQLQPGSSEGPGGASSVSTAPENPGGQTGSSSGTTTPGGNSGTTTPGGSSQTTTPGGSTPGGGTGNTTPGQDGGTATYPGSGTQSTGTQPAHPGSETPETESQAAPGSGTTPGSTTTPGQGGTTDNTVPVYPGSSQTTETTASQPVAPGSGSTTTPGGSSTETTPGGATAPPAPGSSTGSTTPVTPGSSSGTTTPGGSAPASPVQAETTAAVLNPQAPASQAPASQAPASQAPASQAPASQPGQTTTENITGPGAALGPGM